MAIMSAQLTQPKERPETATSPIQWLRKNLFRTWFDALLTVIVAVVLVSLLIRFFTWTTSEAQWTVITANFRVLMQGLYPVDQGWRLVVAVILVTVLAGISWGIWGRMFVSTGLALVVGVLLFVL